MYNSTETGIFPVSVTTSKVEGFHEPQEVTIVGYITYTFNTYGPFLDGRICYDVILISDDGRAWFQRGYGVGSTPTLNPIYELDEEELAQYNIEEHRLKMMEEVF